MQISIDDLKGPEIAALLELHLKTMTTHSPPGSVHALDLEGLRASNITFWTVKDSQHLLGCGALKEIDGPCGEIKSMHTHPNHRGKGVASALMKHIITVARSRGYESLYLETGSMAAFHQAHSLYRHFGFTQCDPFGTYFVDPNSICMTLTL